MQRRGMRLQGVAVRKRTKSSDIFAYTRIWGYLRCLMRSSSIPECNFVNNLHEATRVGHILLGKTGQKSWAAAKPRRHLLSFLSRFSRHETCNASRSFKKANRGLPVG